jgi:hypothetical protein
LPKYKLVPNKDNSPNPTFAAMLEEISANHTVRQMHGMGHKDELIQADFISAAEHLPQEGTVMMPHELMRANWPKGKKAINAGPGAIDIYNKGE